VICGGTIAGVVEFSGCARHPYCGSKMFPAIVLIPVSSFRSERLILKWCDIMGTDIFLGAGS
jgi:hypothetical protein